MTPVAPPRCSSSKLAAGAGAGRTPPSARPLGALLIGGGVLLVCLGAPAVVGAQAPAPESHPAGQPVTSQEPAPPAAQPPGPLPPSAGGPGPEPTPPPGDSGSGEATPPPAPGSSPEVSAAGSGCGGDPRWHPGKRLSLLTPLDHGGERGHRQLDQQRERAARRERRRARFGDPATRPGLFAHLYEPRHLQLHLLHSPPDEGDRHRAGLDLARRREWIRRGRGRRLARPGERRGNVRGLGAPPDRPRNRQQASRRMRPAPRPSFLPPGCQCCHCSPPAWVCASPGRSCDAAPAPETGSPLAPERVRWRHRAALRSSRPGGKDFEIVSR